MQRLRTNAKEVIDLLHAKIEIPTTTTTTTTTSTTNIRTSFNLIIQKSSFDSSTTIQFQGEILEEAQLWINTLTYLTTLFSEKMSALKQNESAMTKSANFIA
jgi:hypothetical protein